MRESNILADNVENISLRRELCLNTKGEYMKEYNNIVLWYPMLGSTISVYQSIAELRQAQGKLQLAMLLVYIFFLCLADIVAKLSSSWLFKQSSVELRLAFILVITPHPHPQEK